MTGKVLLDENKQFQFDFSITPYVWQVHDLTKSTMLSDVDFITEIEGETLFRKGIIFGNFPFVDIVRYLSIFQTLLFR